MIQREGPAPFLGGWGTLKKLYECMPAAEREWLAHTTLLAVVLLFGLFVAVALAPSDTPTQATVSDLPASIEAP